LEPLAIVTTNPRKRILVQHTQGPLKGCFQIMGLWEPLPDHDVPEFVPNVLLQGNRRCEGISLIRVTHSSYIYRELMERNANRVPAYDSMHPEQR
jgi:hypothetical protein